MSASVGGDPDVPAPQVRLLGPISLRVGDTEVALPGRRTRAVLALLALNAGRLVTVDQLLDAIWGEAVTAGTTNTLQSYVSAIRNAVGEAGVVQRRGPGYVLAVAPEHVDAVRFEALVTEARRRASEPHRVVELLDTALELWVGRPLADVDGEPFAAGPVTRLEELHSEALERIFDAELALGRHTELIGRLEAATAEHPLHERFAAQLALAQYRAGRQAESLTSLSRIRTRLRDDLGLSPGDALVELERLILNQDPSLAAPTTVRARQATELPRPAMVSRTHSLIGRRRELDELLRHWNDAQQGRAGVVVVNGEAGVGKTRLLAELAAMVHDDHRSVVWGRCSRERALPYEPFVEAVGALADARRPASAFTELLSRAAEAAPDAGVLALYDAVAEVVTGALEAGGILVIDDVQWADAKTTAMLTHVVEAAARLPVLVLVGRRAVPTGLDADRALDELRRVLPVHRLEVTGLGRDAVAELVAEARGADDALASDLHERTAGNPFFIRELLAAEDAAAPPSTVTDAVALRVGPPDQPLGRLLGAAAVLGGDVDLELIATVAGLDEDAALAALDQALAGDLLREDQDGGEELLFSHVIVRDAAYHSLTGARRRRLHRLAASAMAGRYDPGVPGPHLVEIARHLLDAGRAADRGQLLEASAAAAQWCLGVLAYDEAIELAERTLLQGDDAGAGSGAPRRSEARLRLHLAGALNATGETDGAREHLRSVLRTGEQLDDGGLAADAALALAGGPGAGVGLRWGVVDDELVAALESALTLVAAHDDPTRARLLAALARALYNDPGASARCDEASAEALRLAERVGDPVLLGDALTARCIALWRPTGLEERLALAQRAVRLAEDSGDDALAIAACLRVLPDAFEAADLASVRSALATLDATATRLRQPRFRWFAPLARSALALTTGDIERAGDQADEALAVAGDAQGDGPVLSHLVGTTMIARDRGTLGDCEQALRERVAGDRWNATPRILLAVLLAETGREAEAAEVVHGDLGDGLGRLPRDYLWLGHLGLLAEVVVRAGAQAHVDVLRTELQPARGRLLMLGATAPVGAADRALGLLSATVGDLEDALELCRAARDLHRGIGAPYLQARSEVDLVALHRAAGAAGAARAAGGRAKELADELGLPVPTSPLTGLRTAGR